MARGIWRKIRTGRSVPIDSQLRSHRLFSDNWSRLAHQVDMATLYHTGACHLFLAFFLFYFICLFFGGGGLTGVGAWHMSDSAMQAGRARAGQP